MHLQLVDDYSEYILESCSSPKRQSSTSSPRFTANTMSATAANTATTIMRSASPQSPSKHITVVDVYDLAASIGNDFEKIIDQYGNDSVRGIMPKVISALETLEALASSNDRDNEQVVELQKQVEALEHEKAQRQKHYQKFEEELEQVEKSYRKDIEDLQVLVKNLISENKTLSTTVSNLPSSEQDSTVTTMRDEDLKMLLELKEQSSQQKVEIKTLQKDVDQYVCQVENMQNSIEKLIRQNEELLRKNASLQKQGRMIVEEKMDIIKRMEKTEEQNFELQQYLKEANRTCQDLQQVQSETEPRFTLGELREVLREKNILKGRVMELEEELELVKPGSLTKKPEVEKVVEVSRTEEDNSLPVYGPLPKEPEEKLYPWKYERKDSGVRKFFRFFKELGGASTSPRKEPGTSPRLPTRAIPSSIGS